MLRSHQSDCVALCEQAIQLDRPLKHVILSVTPGGGKSFHPVVLADKLIPRFADRIAWFVPRAALRSQGQEAFRSSFFRRLLGHNMHIGTMPGEGIGFVATYQSLLHHQERFERAFREHRYICVLDEPHHCPSDSEWTTALRPLVDSCTTLVQMSGTFQRHDGRPVAFLPYRQERGSQIFDLEHATSLGVKCIEYTRSQALQERSIIPLEVRWFDLSATWTENGEQKTLFSLSDTEDEELAKEGIYIALRTGAADAILLACYKDWVEYRKTNRRSKLLVVAAHITSARRFKKALVEAGAARVDIAVSTEEIGDKKFSRSVQAHRNIDRFKSQSDDRLEIIVTVGMAYEGLDVPEITHIACLTNIRSAPWIEQMATRATRVDRGPGALPYEQQAAYLYCPDDCLMRECVEAIIEEQQAIASIPRDYDEERAEAEEGNLDAEVEEPKVIEALESEAILNGLSDLEGERLTRAEILKLPALARVTGTNEAILRSMRVSQIRGQLNAYAPMIEAFESSPILKPVVVEAPPPPPEKTKTIGQLRREANQLAIRLDRARSWPFGTANTMVKSTFGKPRAAMTGEELQSVCDWLQRELEPAQVAV